MPLNEKLDSTLFSIEQDLKDIEEEVVKSNGGPNKLSARIFDIAEKVSGLQNG